MASIKDMAKAYEAPKTLNISDLPKVSTDIDVKTETFTKQDGESFDVNVTEIEGKKYRVPVTVLKGLKAIMEKKPDLKWFCVSKTGSGMQTDYQVIPMD